MDITQPIAGIILITIVGIGLLFYFLREKRKELKLSLSSLFITLFIGEFFLASFFPQIMEHNKMFEYDTSLGWNFIPNKKSDIVYPGEAHHGVQINSRGFRDNSINEAQKKQYTIMLIGDSFVSNLAVKDDQVFTEIMQTKLGNTEVFNFGVNGYGQVQELLLLKKWAPKIKPDLIISLIYIRNDFKDNLGGHWMLPRPFVTWNNTEDSLIYNPPPPKRNRKQKNKNFAIKLIEKSHVYNLVKHQLKRYNVAVKSNKKKNKKPSIYTPPERYLCKTELSEDTQVLYRTMEALIKETAAYCDQIDIPIVFAIAPSIVQIEDELWSSNIESKADKKNQFIRTLANDKLMSFAKEENISMLDLFPALYAESQNGKRLYNPKEQHWNKAGNVVVADALLKMLDSNLNR